MRASFEETRASLLFCFLSLGLRGGRGKENGRLQLYIRRRVTLASTRRVEEEGEYKVYTYMVRVYGRCIPVPHRARCAVRRTFFNL